MAKNVVKINFTPDECYDILEALEVMQQCEYDAYRQADDAEERADIEHMCHKYEKLIQKFVKRLDKKEN